MVGRWEPTSSMAKPQLRSRWSMETVGTEPKGRVRVKDLNAALVVMLKRSHGAVKVTCGRWISDVRQPCCCPLTLVLVSGRQSKKVRAEPVKIVKRNGRWSWNSTYVGELGMKVPQMLDERWGYWYVHGFVGGVDGDGAAGAPPTAHKAACRRHKEGVADGATARRWLHRKGIREYVDLTAAA